MRKYCLPLLFALILAICTISDLEASIKNRPYSIHLDLYGIQPALNDSAQIWLFSPYLGGDVQCMLSQQMALVASVRTGSVYNDSVSTSIFKFNNERANRRWSLTSIAIGPKFYLNRRGHTTPYFLTRFEMLLWKIKSNPDSEQIVVEGGDGNQRDFKAAELGLTAGFGLEQLFSERIAFSIGAEFTYLTGIGADFAQWVKNSRSRGILQFSAGLSIHFGRRYQSLLEEVERHEQHPDRVSRKVYEDDTNIEGVTDSARSQPAANADTVAEIPQPDPALEMDSDLDRIVDLYDKCLATPNGAIVDRDGCPLDSDSDGIYDGIDQCPQTASRDAQLVDATGCVPDLDHDGVPDYRDLCPNSAGTIAVDSNGCILDFDKDGIENSLDKCPDTPEQQPVDSLGCPDLVRIFVKRVYHSLFNSGRANIASGQAAVLDTVVTMLRMFADVSVKIYGYTDDVGPNDANLQLSQERADAVRSYLVAAGLAEDRILAMGKGESNYMASNRTRNGREQNRRIELEFQF